MLQTNTDVIRGADKPPPEDHGALAALIDGALDPLFKVAPRFGVPSAWYGHVPFAFWLVEALRPRVVVELGTHNGVSYAAFCEAVATGGIDAKCYAVDTWRGDDQAGFYPERVYSDFSAFHDERYASFSRLLRTTFDDAAAGFADGSIDLLHIDGCHGYDAVRHDFETWRPKLSDRGVVLMHDTNVRERGFGVWRLWAELSGEYPSFEFVHEHGLGVLAVGPALDGPVRALCSLADAAVIATLRHRFAQSGARTAEAVEPSRAEAVEPSRAEGTTAARQEAERLDLIAVAQEVRAADIRQRLERTEQLLAETQDRLAKAGDDLVHKDIQIAHFREFADAYHKLVGSSLWRALEPLRQAASKIPPSLRRMLRRGGKAAWWGATPWRISARLARRRELIALANAPPVVPPPPPVVPPPPYDRFSLDHIAKPRAGYIPLIQYFDPIAPEVSIIILNWNGIDMTLLCLQHLWQYTTGHHYEIIVVDNGSDPAELDKLREQAPFVKLIALGVNRYFGEANNIGVEAARGHYICLLNNDAFVTPGWLEPLMVVFEAERNVGAVGPLFRYPDGGIQEAGALVNPDGVVTQLGRGAAIDDPALRTRRIVDYVSAACVLMRRDDYLRVLGFDLSWEPAYYEDVDLCLKLRLLGLRSFYCPDTSIIHIENATSSNRGKSLRLHNMIEINRTKLLGRWGRYLETAGAEYPDLLPKRTIGTIPAEPRTPRMRVLIYTPYQLTPGGGERYILTIAEAFRDIAHVALVTPQPISRLRLLTMAREFALELDQVELVSPADLLSRPSADIAFVLGNEIFPTVGRMAQHNVYICQFPFPFDRSQSGERRKPLWHEFDLVLTYSEYVRGHVLKAVALWGVVYRPVEILAPPVPMVTQTAPKQRGKILHVGRFFADGHCKRQDKLIDALRILVDQGVAAELHLAGSTMPEAKHRAYYTGLIEQAKGLPVHFHANCSAETLHRLYAESDVYWHATGVGSDIDAEPHVAEHFGITVVEAMSARCIPIVFAAGGPATVVEEGVTGYHFHTLDELAAKTRAVLDATEPTDPMRDAAASAARQFDEPTFRAHVREIAERLVRTEVAAVA